VIEELTPEAQLYGNIMADDTNIDNSDELLSESTEQNDLVIEDDQGTQTGNNNDGLSLEETGQTPELPNTNPRIIENTQDTEGLF